MGDCLLCMAAIRCISLHIIVLRCELLGQLTLSRQLTLSLSLTIHLLVDIVEPMIQW